MDRFTRDDLRPLLAARGGPCVSVFTATSRGGGQGDTTRWKDQLDEVEQRLIESGLRKPDVAGLLTPARDRLTDTAFWRDTSDGLAMFAAPGLTRMYRLPVSFASRAFVGPRFVVRPVLPLLNGAGRFFVLAISENHVRLLEGANHTTRRLPLPGLPENAPARSLPDNGEVPRRGHETAAGVTDHKNELLQAFHDVNRAVQAVLANEKAPLVLATVDSHVPLYRQANKYAHLMDAFIPGSPDRVGDQELHAKAWPLVAPLFRQRAEKALEQFRQFRGTGRTTEDLTELLPAAHRGEIETLFVVGDRQAWGRFDAGNGHVEIDAESPATEELVNAAVCLALERDRAVHVVEPTPEFGDDAAAGLFFVPMNRHHKRGGGATLMKK